MPGKTIIARVKAASTIDLASISANGGALVDLQQPDPADDTVLETKIRTAPLGGLVFAFSLRAQFAGVSWQLTLTEQGKDTPKYKSHPDKVTDLFFEGKDSGFVDFS